MKENIYGIVGSGFLANHLSHFFTIKDMRFISWARSVDTQTPEEKLSPCNIVILAISDDSIEDFISQHNFPDKITLHFSGALELDSTIGFHPLMTFSKNLYTLKEYENIAFVGTEKEETFRSIFPVLENRYFPIQKDQKSLYHALCVISGNFTTILWQKVIKDFEQDLNLPKEILFPYLDQICSNIKDNYKVALTGPIKRGDKITMKKNIKSLKTSSWKSIYKLFNRVFIKELK